MTREWTDIPPEVLATLRRGAVIPAHPLALDSRRHFDPRRQRALTRYYLDAGVGGLAVGVHTTQFKLREAGLYEPVLGLVAETVAGWAHRPIFMVAGITGRTAQALAEARIARSLGYQAGLLNVAAFRGVSEDEILDHCRTLAREIPLFGFYLLPEVGGIFLSADFWRRFAEIDNVVAVKIAPFNRYRTIDVVRGVVNARAEDRVALYTGNDDHIVADLLTPFVATRDGRQIVVRIRGGLLGHWSFWTSRAVEYLERIHKAVVSGVVDEELMSLDAKVTDSNGAIYDSVNDFRGCVPGCHEILRRQGLLEGTWCLDPDETLSPGQRQDIDRVCAAYPELSDDAFVASNLDRWLAS
jgi:hypothetical protein